MKKRLTIADYIAANEKLVAERATLTTERDDALRAEKDSREFERRMRKDIYATLGGDMVYRHSFGDRDTDVSYVQIARRAGELVATERFFHDLKKEVFGEEIQISGGDMKPIDFGRRVMHDIEHDHSSCVSKAMGIDRAAPGGDRTIMTNIPTKSLEEFDKVVGSIVRRMEKRRKARKFWSTVTTIAILAVSFTAGWLLADAIFG